MKQHPALDVLARTLWGEARGEGRLGMECVANVILNRVKSGVRWWGRDVLSVCLAPWQFSCWNKSDPNRQKLLSVTSADKSFKLALEVADKALTGYIEDATNGADSYFASSIETPKWAKGLVPTAEVGHHKFYKTVEWRVQ